MMEAAKQREVKERESKCEAARVQVMPECGLCFERCTADNPNLVLPCVAAKQVKVVKKLAPGGAHKRRVKTKERKPRVHAICKDCMIGSLKSGALKRTMECPSCRRGFSEEQIKYMTPFVKTSLEKPFDLIAIYQECHAKREDDRIRELNEAAIQNAMGAAPARIRRFGDLPAADHLVIDRMVAEALRNMDAPGAAAAAPADVPAAPDALVNHGLGFVHVMNHRGEWVPRELMPHDVRLAQELAEERRTKENIRATALSILGTACLGACKGLMGDDSVFEGIGQGFVAGIALNAANIVRLHVMKRLGRR
jgi:hypothetical protein